MTQWEYRYAQLPSDKYGSPRDMDEFNALGSEGWEMVSMLWGGGTLFGFFKRPV